VGSVTAPTGSARLQPLPAASRVPGTHHRFTTRAFHTTPRFLALVGSQASRPCCSSTSASPQSRDFVATLQPQDSWLQHQLSPLPGFSHSRPASRALRDCGAGWRPLTWQQLLHCLGTACAPARSYAKKVSPASHKSRCPTRRETNPTACKRPALPPAGLAATSHSRT
jgi:hypothetical protein